MDLLESSLRELIDHVREDFPSEVTWELPGERGRKSAPPLTVGLPRFQSYRGRTEAALVEELTDYVEEAGLAVLHLKVIDDDNHVIIW